MWAAARTRLGHWSHSLKHRGFANGRSLGKYSAPPLFSNKEGESCLSVLSSILVVQLCFFFNYQFINSRPYKEDEDSDMAITLTYSESALT